MKGDTLRHLADIFRGAPNMAVVGTCVAIGLRRPVKEAMEVEEVLATAKAIGVPIDMERAIERVLTSPDPRLRLVNALDDQIYDYIEKGG